MPEYLSPGVYVEEFEIGARPIEGVSTSTAGFLGETLRGPLHPRFVSGFEQFKRIYGGYLNNNRFLAYAVDGFFSNGGQRCFVGRIVGDFEEGVDGIAAAQYDNAKLTIRAVGPGIWGNRIAIKINAGSLQDPEANQPYDKVKLTVMYWDDMPPTPIVDPTDPNEATNTNRREPTLLEIYDNLSADPTSIDYWETKINSSSNLIVVDFDENQGENPEILEVLTLISDLDDPVEGVDGDTPTNQHYIGGVLPAMPDGTVPKSGLKGFEQIDEISLVIAPNHHEVNNLHSELIKHCTKMKDRFAILHSKTTDTVSDLNAIRPPQDTTFAAFYFPWIKIYDPRTNQESLIPPSGHIAGIYAKTDVERGVHKAPANVVVQGAISLQFQITKAEQDMLNPRGVNCMRIFPGRGLRVWGARTCSTNTLWKYINVRRLFLYVEESIDEGTQWVVFEPNDEKLWARVRQTITQFLTGVWRDGALMGTTIEQAFFVKCDRTTMTQDDIDNGRLICIIGIAPVKPAEFVIFRITQWSGGSEVAEL